MLIDTHCHLDAAEFEDDRPRIVEASREAGVKVILIPAVAAFNFHTVRELAHATPGGVYALGIHPMFVRHAHPEDLVTLRDMVMLCLGDPRFVGIGEIGMDFFVPAISSGEARDQQEHFYAAQLDLAVEFGLPVVLHVRRSQDVLLKHLRKRPRIGGFAHAFNGSLQQAQQFVDLGFVLGMGGAMTYPRALQIRRIAVGMPIDSLVLETDAPDIPPAWLVKDRRNTPDQVAGIARALAELRGIDLDEVKHVTAENAFRVCPRLKLASKFLDFPPDGS